MGKEIIELADGFEGLVSADWVELGRQRRQIPGPEKVVAMVLVDPSRRRRVAMTQPRREPMREWQAGVMRHDRKQIIGRGHDDGLPRGPRDAAHRGADLLAPDMFERLDAGEDIDAVRPGRFGERRDTKFAALQQSETAGDVARGGEPRAVQIGEDGALAAGQ